MSARSGAMDDAERARLERVAYGPDSDPAEAARARVALARRTGHTDRPGAEASSRPEPPSGPEASSGRSVAATAPVPSADGASDPGGAGTPPTARARQPRAGAPRRWIALGVGVLVLAAGAFGGGIAVGQLRTTSGTTTADRSAKDDADGQITLAEFLAARQTFADQLPGGVRAPVKLHSTRLVWSNRSLEGDDAATPWDVYVAVGTDPSLVCLVASADGLTATETCAPRDAALHGSMTLVAQTASGTLTIRAVDGVVSGSVAPPT